MNESYHIHPGYTVPCGFMGLTFKVAAIPIEVTSALSGNSLNQLRVICCIDLYLVFQFWETGLIESDEQQSKL